MTTPDPLPEIEARLEFMVAGKMEAHPPSKDNSEPTVWCEDIHGSMVELLETPTLDVADFIAHAPTDIATLLALVRRLREQVKAQTDGTS